MLCAYLNQLLSDFIWTIFGGTREKTPGSVWFLSTEDGHVADSGFMPIQNERRSQTGCIQLWNSAFRISDN